MSVSVWSWSCSIDVTIPFLEKGRVMRGQWFYSTDAGAKSFVWFHSVQEMVRRAIQDTNVDYADLGPSGTDAFRYASVKKTYFILIYVKETYLET